MYDDTLHIIPKKIIEKAIYWIEEDTDIKIDIDEFKEFVYSRNYNCKNICIKESDTERSQSIILGDELYKLWEAKNAE